MKRVAVIAIFMAVMASLFAFPVFADTPIQPLQVVSYSDTSTNVRIVGTAERLHYNIDSFQVVFMNPPNNYGTSCTPVLVTLRFFNASDTPAYVGQPEFELTATSGTGNVNTIIYGYDQISTDLFVAESSYSTSEVGRIGIGATNDFAYYTGFVIPPRTTLYFSCIVYVNASAYAQNNTGATEDVNQVTLSALNFYNNQISFSTDYPYHNQPIDFSDIIDAISDLSQTVSTSSEMQSIIQLLTYSGNIPSFSYPNGSDTRININSSLSNYSGSVTRSISKPYFVNTDIEFDSTSDSYINVSTLRYDIRIVVIENVSNTNTVSLSQYGSISGVVPNNTYQNLVLDYVISDIFTGVGYGNYGLTLYRGNNIGYTSYLNNGNHTSIFQFHYDVPYSSIPTFPTFTIDNFLNNINPTVTDIYMPQSEYYILRDLYMAYSSVNGLDDIDDTSNDIKDKSESAHTQEQSYFTQNAQAIQATGLNNYRFNGDQENGIGSVSHDFTLLWNALGGFNSVYIFSLTLSLALMVLRHAPGAIRSSRRNKEE